MICKFQLSSNFNQILFPKSNEKLTESPKENWKAETLAQIKSKISQSHQDNILLIKTKIKNDMRKKYIKKTLETYQRYKSHITQPWFP